MASGSNIRNLRILASIERSFAKLDMDFAEALARLDEATARVSALGEIHLKLATTLMDALGITQLAGSITPLLPGQVEAISSTERVELMASGLLRPILRSLERTCGEIAEAIRISEQRILKATEKFDMTEMGILAAELSRNPERVLGSDELEACKNKVREWVFRLKNSLSESDI